MRMFYLLANIHKLCVIVQVNRNYSSCKAFAADLQNTENETIVIRQPELPNFGGFPLSEFMAVPFSHHIRILEKVKDRDERLYYIQNTARSHLSKEGVIKAIDNDEFHHR